VSYTVRFHPMAQQDYYEAYTWYEERQKGLGERFLSTVRLKINEIAEHPHVYGSRNSKTFRETQVDFFPYLIVFKVYHRISEVHVASVHHTKRHPKRKYRRF
jgi:plasmid stabilization system protein ParE